MGDIEKLHREIAELKAKQEADTAARKQAEATVERNDLRGAVLGHLVRSGVNTLRAEIIVDTLEGSGRLVRTPGGQPGVRVLVEKGGGFIETARDAVDRVLREDGEFAWMRVEQAAEKAKPAAYVHPRELDVGPLSPGRNSGPEHAPPAAEGAKVTNLRDLIIPDLP